MRQSKNVAGVGSADGVELATEPGCKTVVNTSAANGTASATIAALTNPKGIHVCKGIHVSVAAGAAAQGPVQVVLRDGPTSTGTIIWSKTLSAPANQTATVDIGPITIPGSIQKAMTLEFVGAGAANTIEDVTLVYLDLTEGMPQ